MVVHYVNYFGQRKLCKHFTQLCNKATQSHTDQYNTDENNERLIKLSYYVGIPVLNERSISRC